MWYPGFKTYDLHRFLEETIARSSGFFKRSTIPMNRSHRPFVKSSAVMKNMLSITVAGVIGAGLLLGAGCVERRVVYVQQPGEPAVANEPPPPPRTEVIVAAPGPEYSWVPGYWSCNGGCFLCRGSRGTGPPPPTRVVGAR